jgi:hypothetical protein
MRHATRRAGVFPILAAGIALFLLGSSTAQALTDEQLLDELQHRAFNYFWEQTNATNGLIKDRSASWSPCSIASQGFGISAICIGIDHGWITRDQGRARILTALNTYWTKPQGSGASGTIGYKGLYYHFLDMNTGLRTWDSEVSTIDSALLFAGVIDAKQYFSTGDPLDVQVRSLADSIYRRADWEFFRNFLTPIQMGWKPGTGFSGFGGWIGYNEAMVLYILALGSPTHPIAPNGWSAWTSGYDWLTYYGYTYVNFPPLFGHQYSHCWIDFRYIQDAYMRSKGITYFENSRRATMAQRAYCIANPGGWLGYGVDLWGLTASDDPDGYVAHGAPPPQSENGTITPTAAASSIPFTPTESMACMQNMYNTYGAYLWSNYGFKDAFNLTRGWYGPDYIGIDQGPIIVMIENYRTGAVWNRFKSNPDIQLGLERAGFTVAADVAQQAFPVPAGFQLYQNAPNPFEKTTTIRFLLDDPGYVLLTVTDASGREIARLVDGAREAGIQTVTLAASNLPSGVYYYNLQHDGQTVRRPCVLVK